MWWMEDSDDLDLRMPRHRFARRAHVSEKVWGIRVVGSRVFVAADFFGLGILDVSRPSALTLVGSLKTPGQAKNVAVIGLTALVADHMTGVDVIDVSVVSAPAKRGSFFLEGTPGMSWRQDRLRARLTRGRTLRVRSVGTDKLDSLEPVGSEQSATAPGSIELRDEAHRRGGVDGRADWRRRAAVHGRLESQRLVVRPPSHAERTPRGRR
jgi:hypothetical protein